MSYYALPHMHEHALESAKVKLHNSIPQTSSAVSAISRAWIHFMYYTISACTRKLKRGV